MKVLITGNIIHDIKFDDELIVHIGSVKYTTENKKYIFINGNINSLDLINYVLNKYEITKIIHFFLKSDINVSPIDYTKENIIGIHNLLELSHKYEKLQEFCYITNKKTQDITLFGATQKSIEPIIQLYNNKLPIIIYEND
uniref:NAD(P)-binding domain-containing protein n=1 Tax=viral metagenome TaxID=1070528 RepID=A0A6C0H6G8_9ZZZZ